MKQSAPSKRKRAAARKRINPRARRPGYFRVGDRVRIKNYRKLFWGDRKPQEYGFIVAINGGYHYVRPRWRPVSEQFEFYNVEIELANFK